MANDSIPSVEIDPRAVERKFPVNLFFAPEELRTLPRLIASNAQMAATWRQIAESTRALLVRGAFDIGSRPYIYTLGNELPKLALAYLLSRNEHLGDFLRYVLLDTAERPMEFWIHAEIRKYDPERPVGGLETATLARGVAMALNWASDVLSHAEERKVRDALHAKGLEPSVRWLANPRMNNWRAVMSAGAFITAKVLGDAEAMAIAQEHLRDFLRVVESDGSYGEQIEYFEYAIWSLIIGFTALGLDKVSDVINRSGLVRSLEWMIYYYAFVADGPRGFDAGRINFGDDDFPKRPNPAVAYFLANVTGSGLGTWLIERFYGHDVPGDWVMLVLQSHYRGNWPQPESPEELGLATLRAFDNGVGFLRSSWKPDGLLLGIRSGGASRTQYAHDRPDRNSIALFAGGEYLLVAPGRACYRSPLRKSWDLRTSSHNTITFDGKDQIKESDAAIVAARTGELIDYLASEAARSYPNRPERVRRHILFVKEPGYFLIVDEVKCRAGELTRIDSHLHFNNHDGRGFLLQVSDSQWVFHRPRASLQVYCASSDQLTHAVEDGIMHIGYSYYPDGPNEGKPGSSIKLRTTTQRAVSETQLYTVLLPLRPENRRAEIHARTTGRSASITIAHETYTDSFQFDWALLDGGTSVATSGDLQFVRRQGERRLAHQALSLE